MDTMWASIKKCSIQIISLQWETRFLITHSITKLRGLEKINFLKNGFNVFKRLAAKMGFCSV